MAYKIDPEKCVGCGTCAEECPNEAIKEAGDKYAICADDCVDCGTCAETCPESAISEE